VAVEEFSYGADGSIPSISKTSEGVTESAEPLNPFARVEAETIAWEEGIETEPCSEGGMNVTDISDGDYIKVEAVEFGAGADSFNYRVATASGGGAIELRLDGENGELVGTCAVESSGGADTWATQECAVNITGQHDLFLRFTGGGFEFDWWQFAGPGEPTTDGAGGSTTTAATTTTATATQGGGADAATTGGTTTATTGTPQTSGTTGVTAGTTGATSATGGGTTAGPATTAATTSTSGMGGAGTTGGLGDATATGGAPSSSAKSPSDEGCACGVAGAKSAPSRLGLLGALGLMLLGATRRHGRRGDQG
jgi:MYXO-CTERM domain-containing protein